jgi:GNAT superfamily N-acetyltransferase
MGIPVSRKLQIRPATGADLTGVSQIIAESFHSQKGLWGWAFPLFRLGIYEDLRHRLTPSSLNNTCLIAIDLSSSKSNHIIGTVELGVRSGKDWSCRSRYFPYLSNLAVAPQYRRHGVASSLILGCERISQTWGFQDLYLHVLEHNYQARQLYSKLGYRMYKIEPYGNMFVFHPSRQLFLHKHLSSNSTS